MGNNAKDEALRKAKKTAGKKGHKKKGERQTFDPERNKDVIELYERYHRGEITRNKVFEELWKILQPQVNDQIGIYDRRLNADDKDLEQSAILAVLEKIDDYDPTKSVPGSYFLNWINEAHRDLCRGNKSIYYLNTIRKLTAVAQEAGFEGIGDRELSDVALASLSGESIQVVKRARYMDFIYTPVDYEGVEDAVEDSYHSSPEKIFFQSDREEKGLEAFKNELDEFEQKLYFAHAAETRSFKEISVTLKTDNYYLEFGFKTAPSPSELQRRFAVCDRKLAGNRAVAEERRKQAEEHNSIFEQASESRLEELMESDDFDDLDDI